MRIYKMKMYIKLVRGTCCIFIGNEEKREMKVNKKEI